MKRLITLAVSMLILCTSTCHAETEKEILFRDIPWGSSYTEVKQILGDQDWYTMSFDYMRHYPVDEVLTDDAFKSDMDFENGGINMTATPFSNKEIQVAGYTTTDISLYFAYTEVGAIQGENDDATALYGARYEFEPKDVTGMTEDLIEKLSSIYGEPDSTDQDTDLWSVKTTMTYWNGANDTVVALRSVDASEDTTTLYDDEISIAYAWKEGDNLLKAIDDAVSGEAADQESAKYGDGDTSGL